LALCHVTGLYGIESVARMALIPHASDAGMYVRLTGREPNLKTQDPAWLLLFGKPLAMPKEGATWENAVCAVIGGVAGFYAIGDVVTSDGVTSTPLPVDHEPTKALPTLAP
jgi:hypothetical protein